LSTLQEVSVSNVLSWLSGLSSMSSDSRLLRGDTKLKMAEMSLRYLKSCQELGLSLEDIGSMSSILDLILDVDVDESHDSSSSSSPELIFSLLDAYNGFIQSDMVADQKPVNVLSRLFRSSHYCIDGNDLGNLTLSPPRSGLEEYLNTPSQQAILPWSVLESVTKVSIVESPFANVRRSNTTKNSQDSTRKVLNVPLQIKFHSTPCTSNVSSLNASSCVTQVRLRKLFAESIAVADHHRAMSLPFAQRSFEEVVEWQCVKDDYSNHNLSCMSGVVLELTCTGSAGVMSRRCPISEESDLCVSLLDDRDCRWISLPPENDDNMSVTCECSLQNLHESMSTDDSPITISIGVMTRSVAHDFVSTWLSADDMSGTEVLNNLTVLFSTVGVSFLGGLVMFISLLLDKQDEKKALLKSVQQSSKHSSDSQSSFLMPSFLKSASPSFLLLPQDFHFLQSKKNLAIIAKLWSAVITTESLG
jgi:hypothetical protein